MVHSVQLFSLCVRRHLCLRIGNFQTFAPFRGATFTFSLLASWVSDKSQQKQAGPKPKIRTQIRC
jgi:hypothetical protein